MAPNLLLQATAVVVVEKNLEIFGDAFTTTTNVCLLGIKTLKQLKSTIFIFQLISSFDK